MQRGGAGGARQGDRYAAGCGWSEIAGELDAIVRKEIKPLVTREAISKAAGENRLSGAGADHR